MPSPVLTANRPIQLLSEQIQTRRKLNRLCAEAVDWQIKHGSADASQLRNRRRHLVKHVLKRIPHASRHNPNKLLHAAVMVLALWGFTGLAIPIAAQAASPEPVFLHSMLDGFDVGFTAAPVFADIDGDGDLDAFVGESSGTVKFYRNTGSNIFVADAGTNPLDGIAVGYRPIPTFADIDDDGDLDVFVGEFYGTVKFYRNTGSKTIPTFEADAGANPLAGVAVGLNAAPSFADIDGDGDLDVFVGEYYGSVKFYRNTGSKTTPTFAAAANPLAGVAVGYGAVPTFVDIDNDGDLDVFVGEWYGTVKFYRNTGSNTAPTMMAAAINPLAGVAVDGGAAPAFADVDGDGDLDAFIGVGGPCCDTGTVKFYRNTGSNISPTFTAAAATNPLAGVNVILWARPTFADIDADGDLDAFVGAQNGTTKLFLNTGSNTAPTFVADSGSNALFFDVGFGAAPTFADIDGDGDLDAFVGETFGTVKFYRNNGSSTTPTFVADAGTNPLAGVAVGTTAAPTFADIDDDGDLDAFVGEKGSKATPGTMKFYRNTGSKTAPTFVADTGTNPLAGFAVGYRSTPTFADIDGDGDLDAFVGENDGTVKFFENLAYQSIVLPAAAGTLRIGTLTTGAFTPTSSLSSATPVNPPAGSFPFGQVNFNVTTTTGGTAVVRLVFPAELPEGFVVYKVDMANNYTVIPAANYTQLNSSTLDITLIDGGDFDLDGVANGVIVDPIAVSVPGVSDTLFSDSFEDP